MPRATQQEGRAERASCALLPPTSPQLPLTVLSSPSVSLQRNQEFAEDREQWARAEWGGRQSSSCYGDHHESLWLLPVLGSQSPFPGKRVGVLVPAPQLHGSGDSILGWMVSRCPGTVGDTQVTIPWDIKPQVPGLPSPPGKDARCPLSIPRWGDTVRVPTSHSALVGRGQPSEMRSEALEDVQLSFN